MNLRLAAIALAALVPAYFTCFSPAAAESATTTAAAPARSSAKEAKAMLERAVAYLQSHEPERAFAAFNNQKGDFYYRDLYTFVVGIDDGIMHAHGGAPEGLVGADVRDLRDTTGKPIIQEMLAVARKYGGGKVDYVWLNRVNNRVEDKTTVVRQVGKYLVGVGYYTPRSSAAQAQALLRLAVAHAREEPGSAMAAFNDPNGAFVNDDLYVFAVDLDTEKFLAMGADPALVGTDAAAMHDAAGKPIIADMITMAQDKGSGIIDYVWRNPVTNRVEDKHSFIQRVGNYLLGVGYYTR